MRILRVFLLTLNCIEGFFLVACSEYPEMEDDILAFHVFSEGQFDASNDDDEYVDLLSKSYGMSPSKVQETQKLILSKKTESNLHYAYEGAMHAKVVDLLDKNGMGARNDFVVNVLAPYLDALTKNIPYKSGLDRTVFEADVVQLFGRFFGNSQTLENFMDDVYRYNGGDISDIGYLNSLNEILMPFGLFVDWNPQNNLNILKIKDSILSPTEFKGSSITILNLKRLVPGLMPSKLGYSTADSKQVILIDDMVNMEMEETAIEVEQGRFFSKYEDKRFEKFWHSIGLDLNVDRASKTYRSLMKKDLAGHTRTEIKKFLAMEVAVHEAKHLADQIEHPELTLNLDAEFAAHVTAAIYSPSPNVALMSAIQRMENYAMYHRLSKLDGVVARLWNMALRSANNELYTNDSLRRDLMNLYNQYRTIRENRGFEPLGDFEAQIVQKIAEFYNVN